MCLGLTELEPPSEQRQTSALPESVHVTRGVRFKVRSPPEAVRKWRKTIKANAVEVHLAKRSFKFKNFLVKVGLSSACLIACEGLS